MRGVREYFPSLVCGARGQKFEKDRKVIRQFTGRWLESLLTIGFDQ